MLGGEPLQRGQLENAIRAAQACPTFALLVESDGGADRG
jgi:ferredoxin